MNAYDIPELDPAMAADTLALPVTKWGTRSRREPMEGTWHFYTHDYKFTSLIKLPGAPWETHCRVCVEPNFSSWDEQPQYDAIRLIGEKRRIAATWQSLGIRTIVDLNVPGRFSVLNLIGVPQGWPSYATRVHRDKRPAEIEDEFVLAQRRSGRLRPLFAVFGGGDAWKDLCKTRGWLWIPEHRQVVAGRHPAYGQR